jgi:hypothetical protein
MSEVCRDFGISRKTGYGRVCIYRKKINISIVLAGQKLGLKEVDDGIWLVSFMHYDLGYIDLEQKTLQTIVLGAGEGIRTLDRRIDTSLRSARC